MESTPTDERPAAKAAEVFDLGNQIRLALLSSPDRMSSFCRAVARNVHKAGSHFPPGVVKDRWYADMNDQFRFAVKPISAPVNIRTDLKPVGGVYFALFDDHPLVEVDQLDASPEIKPVIIRYAICMGSACQQYGKTGMDEAIAVASRTVDMGMDRTALMREMLRCVFAVHVTPVCEEITQRVLRVKKPELDEKKCNIIDRAYSSEKAIPNRLADDMFSRVDSLVTIMYRRCEGDATAAPVVPEGMTLAGTMALRALRDAMATARSWRCDLSIVPSCADRAAQVEFSFPSSAQLQALRDSLEMGLDNINMPAFREIAHVWLANDTESARVVPSWDRKSAEQARSILTDGDDEGPIVVHELSVRPGSISVYSKRPRRCNKLSDEEIRAKRGRRRSTGMSRGRPRKRDPGADGDASAEAAAAAGDKQVATRGTWEKEMGSYGLEVSRNAPLAWAPFRTKTVRPGGARAVESESEDGHVDEECFSPSASSSPESVGGGTEAGCVHQAAVDISGGGGGGGGGGGEEKADDDDDEEEGDEYYSDDDEDDEEEDDDDDDMDSASVHASAGAEEAEESGIGPSSSSLSVSASLSADDSSGFVEPPVGNPRWVDGINYELLASYGGKGARRMRAPGSGRGGDGASGSKLWSRLKRIRTRYDPSVLSACVLTYLLSPPCAAEDDGNLPTCVSFARRIAKGIMPLPVPCVESWPMGEHYFSTVMFPHVDYRRIDSFYEKAGVGSKRPEGALWTVRWWGDGLSSVGWEESCEKMAMACLAFYVAKSSMLMSREGECVTIEECFECVLWCIKVVATRSSVDLRQAPASPAAAAAAAAVPMAWVDNPTVRNLAARSPATVRFIFQGVCVLVRLRHSGILLGVIRDEGFDLASILREEYRRNGKIFHASICDAARYACRVSMSMWYLRAFESSCMERRDLLVATDRVSCGKMVKMFPRAPLSVADLHETLVKMSKVVACDPAGWKVCSREEDQGGNLRPCVVTDRRVAEKYTLCSICYGISRISPLFNRAISKRAGISVRMLPPSVVITPSLFSADPVVRHAALLGLGQLCCQSRAGAYDWGYNSKTVLEPYHSEFSVYSELPVLLSILDVKNILSVTQDPVRIRRRAAVRSDPPYFEGSQEKFIVRNGRLFRPRRDPHAKRDRPILPHVSGHAGRKGERTREMRISTLNRFMHGFVASFLSMRSRLYVDVGVLRSLVAAVKKYIWRVGCGPAAGRDAMIFDMETFVHQAEMSMLPSSTRGVLALGPDDLRMPNVVYFRHMATLVRTFRLHHSALSEAPLEAVQRLIASAADSGSSPSLSEEQRRIFDAIRVREALLPLIANSLFKTHCSSDIYIRFIANRAYEPIVLVKPGGRSHRRKIAALSRTKLVPKHIKGVVKAISPQSKPPPVKLASVEALRSVAVEAAARPPRSGDDGDGHDEDDGDDDDDDDDEDYEDDFQEKEERITRRMKEDMAAIVRKHTPLPYEEVEPIVFAMGNSIMSPGGEVLYDVARFSDCEIKSMEVTVEALSRIACLPWISEKENGGHIRASSITALSAWSYWTYRNVLRANKVLPFAYNPKDKSPIYHYDVQAFTTSPYVSIGRTEYRGAERGSNFGPFTSPTTHFIDFVAMYSNPIYETTSRRVSMWDEDADAGSGSGSGLGADDGSRDSVEDKASLFLPEIRYNV